MQSLKEGDKLGPYEILEAIGKGGMGEVFRARDSRMNRDVAIKISAEAFSDRFSREVHAVAALSHPNVCTLHDVGPDYLVMELVEGPTLAERIEEGAIPVEEALRIARQIAAALEAAHEKGVIHRDLKPGNIKVRPDGTVKVLDFGLAKLDGTPTATTDQSPTLSMHATQAGMILGTAAYMSPEQARGKVVDKRSDIWAFGVVLHEMVTGKRLFEGEDLTETVASVVKVEPNLGDAPPNLRRLLKKCLEKDPRKRLRDIGDVWELLGEAPETAVSVPQPSGRARILPWVVAVVLLLAFATVGFVHFREIETPPLAVQFQMDPPPESEFANVYAGYAPSPDGRYVVFTARAAGAPAPSLWLRPLDSPSMRQLPGTENGASPFWSPDSESLAFVAEGKLKRIELNGGAPVILGDAPIDPVTPVGTWNRNGVILFGSAAGLWRVAASGGGVSLLTKVDPAGKETGHGYPQFLPDGNHFLYFVASTDPNAQGVYASAMNNPQQRQLILLSGTKAAYVPPRSLFPGYLLWMQDQTLLAQRFDADSLERQGDPVSVAEDIGLNPVLPIRSSFWASEAGLLMYFSRPTVRKRPIVWIGRDGKQLGDVISEDNAIDIALAPGAERMAVARSDSPSGKGNQDIWVREFARDVMTRLTFDAGVDGLPVWSPDGKWIAFSSQRDGARQIYRKEASGAGQEERLTEGPTPKLLLDWSDDGKYLLYREQNPKTRNDLMALALEGDKKPFPVVQTEFQETTGAISPDGRWVAYSSNDSGRLEIYVQAFPGVSGTPTGRWQISNGGAVELRWRGDGRELYYESLDGKVMAATVQAGPQGIRAETPRVLFSADYTISNTHEFDVTPDGQRFLLILNSRSEVNTTRLTVVSNWQAALRK